MNSDPRDRAVSALRRDFRELCDDLISRGWSLKEARLERGYGDVVVALEKGLARIWLLRDRGEWLVEVGPPTWPLSFLPSEWREALVGERHPYGLDVTEEIVLLKADAASISAAISSELIALTKMREIRGRKLREMPVPWQRA